MEVIFEIIIQIILEIVLEIIAQILVELGFGWFVRWLKTKIKGDPIYIGIAYFLIGLFLGGLSLLFFPDPIIKNYGVKVLYFIFSPILIGLSLCFFNWLLKGKVIGERFFRIEKFIDGVIFALAYSLTRFYFNL
jgi:ABC-type uncharacterized transport system permease subunit